MTFLQDMGEFGGVLVGFLLTICVLSFVIKDNPLYKLAVHLLVGVSAGYATVIVVRDVFYPVLNALLADVAGNGLLWIVPMILALMLLLKTFPRTTVVGNSAMAVLMAIGASVAFAGAVAGTLLPQLLIRHDDALLGLLLAILTITTLAYFFFTGRAGPAGETQMPRWYPAFAVPGRVVITMTLAGLFAGVLSTSLVILTERVGYFVTEFGQFFADFLS